MAYAALLLVMSIVTFGMYGWDKRQSRRESKRIPESRLHWFALLGGWPGALAGRQYFRHKTRKTWFTTITWSITGIHLVLIGVMVFYCFS